MLTAVLSAVAITSLVCVAILERVRRTQVRDLIRTAVRLRLGRALAEGLIAGESVDNALRTLVPHHADWCVLHLVEGPRVRRAAVVHVDPDLERALKETFQRVPFVADAHVGPAQVIRSGRAEVADRVNEAMLERQPDADIFRRAGLGGYISVPIKSRRATVGALTLHSRTPRAFGEKDLAWTQDIGHRIGLSIENRRLYMEARQLFEQSVSANFVSTPEGALLACNQRFAALLGFNSTEEACATPASALFVDPSARALLVAQLRATGRVLASEVALRRRDGRVVTVLAEAAGEVDDSGELLKIRGFLIDRTGQKNLEAQLRQAQRLEAVGQLAGGIAHDFNNLLTVIIGCADLLKMGPASAVVDRDETLDELVKAARRAASLTQQLLSFSRRQVLRPRIVRLNDVLRSVESLLRHLAPPRITLTMDLAAPADPVRFDPGQLDQVVVNLVVNAVDAIPENGTITVSTANVALTGADVEQYPYVVPGCYLALTVKDTGTGMDEATRARVFEPFFTTKPAGKGTGLGLATVYGIVKESGGYVWIASEVGIGTSVRICLPVVTETPGAA